MPLKLVHSDSKAYPDDAHDTYRVLVVKDATICHYHVINTYTQQLQSKWTSYALAMVVVRDLNRASRLAG